ncbi:MAG: DnaJ C-terminal domain-containing protein [Paracoccaceae bacterium]
MSDDPYERLGVPKAADKADIKKAYRKLAKQFHPDVRPGDAAAESRFKDVTAAYELLADPEQRARFDRGEIDGKGVEKPAQPFYRHYAQAPQGERYSSSAGYEDFADMSDLFAGLRRGGARGGGARRGEDLRYQLEVEFLDAANGAKRRITMPDGNALDITIPAGIRDGGAMRLKGKGAPGFGGAPGGDAFVTVSVKAHSVFTREGDDIVMRLPISIDEAVLGGKVEAPTITGRVAITVPKGASSGIVLRLKGRGVKSGKDGAPGDQRVVLEVALPDSIDPELEAFMTKWRQSRAYDPRAKMRRTP